MRTREWWESLTGAQKANLGTKAETLEDFLTERG